MKLNPPKRRRKAKSNDFKLSFTVSQTPSGKLQIDKMPFSFDAAQFPALLQGDNLSDLGVNVLCDALANCIVRVTDLHEEATGIPASKIKERVISKLEVRKLKLIGV